MIKVAIVGIGSISSSHIAGYLEFPDQCKITALVDIFPEKARNKKEFFQLKEAGIYDNLHEILGMDIDLIDICTPPLINSHIL
jgi:UDP-N-acetyl-2-amino-2-deoxyglucuronate dehydrogenase